MIIGRHPLNSMKRNAKWIFSDKKLLTTDLKTHGRTGRFIKDCVGGFHGHAELTSRGVSCFRGGLRWVASNGPHIFGPGEMASAEMYTHILKNRTKPWI